MEKLKTQNKAVYTAELVADGWAGAENLEKALCYGPTDRRTDGPKSSLQSRVSATKNRFINVNKIFLSTNCMDLLSTLV